MRVASRILDRGGLISVLHPGGFPSWHLEHVRELGAQGRLVLGKLLPCARTFSVLSGVTFQGSILEPGTPFLVIGPGDVEHRMTQAFRDRYE